VNEYEVQLNFPSSLTTAKFCSKNTRKLYVNSLHYPQAQFWFHFISYANTQW